ncbi:hypothetical protein EML15_09320 [Corynebacterium sp. sy017]|uniref:hypothetical protein n=1 Tax=unclassified Corynebacterium TaxID=2624378 RepID=UPI001184D88F|nr:MULTISPECIES: hypothetical protein [unclassified Corynebacterium]MBP3089339.1 hypothetical protein [Corynebacterium sp. sy017]QDZ43274.1 hypothetical protein FQV43_09005 [Corynebacterium sp. sy039]TSD90963.1 hypothetical protein ELY17_09280 [Corynebacterium sp. SY003]
MRNSVVLGAGVVGVAALIVGGVLARGGEQTATAPSVENAGYSHNQVEASIDGEFVPGNELAIIADCQNTDTRAELTTSFGDRTVMSPGADVSGLLAYVTAPANLEAGPVDGFHTFTVTCESGNTGTFLFTDPVQKVDEAHSEERDN